MKRTLTTALALLIGTFPLFAQEADAATVQENLNYVWTIIAACMVFFMQAGFTLVETGFTRAKNALNIVMKNVMDVSAGGLAFFFIGFGLMFGTTAGGWIGTDGFALSEIGDYSNEWSYTFFFFQAADGRRGPKALGTGVKTCALSDLVSRSLGACSSNHCAVFK